MPLDRQSQAAIRRYGPLVNGLARRRYNISGQALLAKLDQGESGDRMGAVSTAGARGKTQFTAGSRETAIRRFGIDPWRSTDEAFHAAALHLLGKINGSKGLEGYNPGDPHYPAYILSQRVGNVARQLGADPQRAAAMALPQGQGISDVLRGILTPQRVTQPSVSAPPLPAFAARTPSSGVAVSASPVEQRPTVESLLAAIRAQSPEAPVTPSGSGRSASRTKTGAGASGTVRFDGKPVRPDFADQLAWARKHGWTGTVTSGFRTKAEQLAAAKRFGLGHYPNGPLASNHVVGHRGAVDVSDPDGLDAVLRRYPGRRTLFRGMADDPVHFSPTGH